MGSFILSVGGKINVQDCSEFARLAHFLELILSMTNDEELDYTSILSLL